jgi:hypothetical protein
MRAILLVLSWPQCLRGVEAPDSFQQSLPAQDLMAARDDALEVIGDVEDRRIAIGDLGIQRKEIGAHGQGPAREDARE